MVLSLLQYKQYFIVLIRLVLYHCEIYIRENSGTQRVNIQNKVINHTFNPLQRVTAT